MIRWGEGEGIWTDFLPKDWSSEDRMLAIRPDIPGGYCTVRRLPNELFAVVVIIATKTQGMIGTAEEIGPYLLEVLAVGTMVPKEAPQAVPKARGPKAQPIDNTLLASILAEL